MQPRIALNSKWCHQRINLIGYFIDSFVFWFAEIFLAKFQSSHGAYML